MSRECFGQSHYLYSGRQRCCSQLATPRRVGKELLELVNDLAEHGRQVGPHELQARDGQQDRGADGRCVQQEPQSDQSKISYSQEGVPLLRCHEHTSHN